MDASPTLTLTVDEAAAELRVSRRTLYRLIESGELPRVKIGSTTRITRAALEHYVAGDAKAAAS